MYVFTSVECTERLSPRFEEAVGLADFTAKRNGHIFDISDSEDRHIGFVKYDPTRHRTWNSLIHQWATLSQQDREAVQELTSAILESNNEAVIEQSLIAMQELFDRVPV